MSNLTTKDKKKQNKTLSFISSPRFPLIKSLQSPIGSPQMTDTTVLSPNQSRLEKFITTFQTFHNSFHNKPFIHGHNRFKSISHLKPTKEKEDSNKKTYQDWISINQMETSTISFPVDIENLKKTNGFHSFTVNNYKETDKGPLDSVELITQKDFIDKQLIFNENQINVLKSNLSSLQQEKNEELVKQFKKKQQLYADLKHRTAKTKESKFVSNFNRPSEDDFLEETEESEFFQGRPCFKFYVNQINFEEVIIKPSIRESASFNIINFKGYLFGGLSNQLLNSMYELEISN